MVRDPHVSAEKRGALGLLTLRRPAALNALSHGMVRALDAVLRQWAEDPDITAVAMRGEGPRAFCAGGDIRAWANEGPEAALAFLADEYRLNAAIAAYPKPYVALMHGIVMGGGAGVSVHGRYRLADASLVFAMPEVGIGFLPDVGASYFLPRLPPGCGLYLALTAGRIGAADAQALGLVTHAVAMTDFEALLESLAGGEAPEKAVAGLARAPGVAPLATHLPRIAALFGAGSVEMVLERLARDGSAFALATANAMRAHSPTALKVAFEALRRGAQLSLPQCLQQEWRAATHLLRGSDFHEGVCAALIDKDRAPRWRPDALAAISGDDIMRYFAPLDEGELFVPPVPR